MHCTRKGQADQGQGQKNRRNSERAKLPGSPFATVKEAARRFKENPTLSQATATQLTKT